MKNWLHFDNTKVFCHVSHSVFIPLFNIVVLTSVKQVSVLFSAWD